MTDQEVLAFRESAEPLQVQDNVSFSVVVENLYDVLKMVGSVIEHSQVMQILSYVKIEVSGDKLIATASDSEVELVASTGLVQAVAKDFSVALSCRKMIDICRTLPSDGVVTCTFSKGWLKIQSAESKFTLATLPADSFPVVSLDDSQEIWEIHESLFQRLLAGSTFAMAEQDVRFFLNGLHIRVMPNTLQMIATDGHRLAVTEASGDYGDLSTKCIIPRKSSLALLRLLNGENEAIKITQTSQHIRINHSRFQMTSNLLEGSVLESEQLIPDAEAAIQVGLNRLGLKQALSRAAILSHEKFRGAKLQISPNNIKILAHNTEQEKTEDALPIDYQGEAFEMAFNINYLQDVLGVLEQEDIMLTFIASRGNVIIREESEAIKKTYVVMSLNI